MKKEIINYFIFGLKCSETVAIEMFERLYSQRDIYLEFEYWFKNKKFLTDHPVDIDGYTAQGLYEQFNIMEIGAFNLMVSLRIEHDDALDYIKNGLPM